MDDEMEYGVFYVLFVLLMFLVTPCLALPQLAYDSPTSTYIVSDKTGGKTYEVARLTLIENTNQCFTDCYAKIRVNVTNQSLFNTYLTYLAYNDNSIIFRKMNLTYEAPYLYLRATKKINPSIISKNGNEEKINMNNNYDWLINVGGITLDNWAWWNSSWNYRIPFNVTNVVDNKTNYQLKLLINSSITSGTNYSYYNISREIRIANDSGYEFPLWVENNLSTITTIYIIVNLTQNQNQTLYLYYGNPTATTVSNKSIMGSNFPFFWDFSNDSVDYMSGNNGTPNYPYVSFNSSRNGYPAMAYNFSGNNISWINASDSSVFDTQNFTIISWIKNNRTTASSVPYSKFWDGSARQLYFSFRETYFCTGNVAFCIGKSGFANCACYDFSNYSDNQYHQYTVKLQSNRNMSVFIDGVLKVNKTADADMVYNSAPFVFGQQAYSGSLTGAFQGSIYGTRFYNYSMSDSEIASFYIATEPTITFYTEEFSEAPPIVTFISQTPTLITPTTLFSQRINISYSITDSDDTAVNNSTVQIYYKVNTTELDGAIYTNGTLQTGYSNTSYDSASGTTYNFSLGDSKVYPASYNIEQQYMQQTAKINYALSGTNHYIFQEILNITPSNLTVVELYAVPPATASTLQVWVCNQSKVQSIQTSSSCFLLCNILNTQSYNHTHTVNSKHYVCAYSVNTSSNLTNNNVKARETMYIYARSSNSQVWYIEYISNTSRVNATMYSTNSGVAYSNLAGTTDSHFHFYTGLETAYYKVCANDTVPSEGCSAERNITINTTTWNPSTPIVYIPNSSQVYYKNETINITYSNSTTFDGSNLTYYNISLLSSSLGYLIDIQANNSLSTSYNWNISAIANGYYVVRVGVCTTNGLCSYGYSDVFRIQSVFVLNPNKREVVRCVREYVTI